LGLHVYHAFRLITNMPREVERLGAGRRVVVDVGIPADRPGQSSEMISLHVIQTVAGGIGTDLLDDEVIIERLRSDSGGQIADELPLGDGTGRELVPVVLRLRTGSRTEGTQLQR